MQKHFYDLRYKLDEDEWRARAKRGLILQLWEQFRNPHYNKTKMLDFGCGTGTLQNEFAKKITSDQTFGIDTSSDAIKFTKMRGVKNAFLFNGKIIPFKDNSFDLITAIDVIEHVQDDLKAIKEIHRVLKTGGIGIFLVPAHQNLWSTRDIRLEHFRRYKKKQLAKIAKLAGLKVLTEKNVDFTLYFLFKFLHKYATKKDGVADLKMDSASTHPILNEILYYYELLENSVQRFATFPVGISIVNVVKKL